MESEACVGRVTYHLSKWRHKLGVHRAVLKGETLCLQRLNVNSLDLGDFPTLATHCYGLTLSWRKIAISLIDGVVSETAAIAPTIVKLCLAGSEQVGKRAAGAGYSWGRSDYMFDGELGCFEESALSG